MINQADDVLQEQLGRFQSLPPPKLQQKTETLKVRGNKLHLAQV